MATRHRWLPTFRQMVLILPNILFLLAIDAMPILEGRPVDPLRSLVAPLAMIGALLLLWWAVQSTHAAGLTSPFPIGRFPWLGHPVLRFLLIAPIVFWGILVWINQSTLAFTTPPYYNGSLAYLHADAELVLRGQNPYTQDETLWRASVRWPTLLPTPLLRGRFAHASRQYPAPDRLRRMMRRQIADVTARHGEFDPATAHNYPAGMIWLLVPFVWAGVPSIQWLNVLAIGIMALLILWRTPLRWRVPLALLITCQTAIFYTSFDAIALVFVLAAWHWRERPIGSALCLGLGCAVKQLAWFFIPFYLIEIGRRDGWQAAIERAKWLALGFFLPNAPFLFADPAAWLHSQFVPLVAPLFPGGVGIVAPALGGIWPLWPSWIHAALELALWLGLAIFQLRRKAITSDGLLLALIPLLAARRDFGTYHTLTLLLALWLVANRLANSSCERTMPPQAGYTSSVENALSSDSPA